jgi:hypothetical protein
VKHPRANRELTDLDAAFFLLPPTVRRQHDLSNVPSEMRARYELALRSVGAEGEKTKPLPLFPPYFVIVEAKHYVSRAKVVRKMRQAATMVHLWELYRAALAYGSPEEAASHGIAEHVYSGHESGWSLAAHRARQSEKHPAHMHW